MLIPGRGLPVEGQKNPTPMKLFLSCQGCNPFPSVRAANPLLWVDSPEERGDRNPSIISSDAQKALKLSEFEFDRNRL